MCAGDLLEPGVQAGCPEMRSREGGAGEHSGKGAVVPLRKVTTQAGSRQPQVSQVPSLSPCAPGLARPDPLPTSGPGSPAGSIGAALEPGQ